VHDAAQAPHQTRLHSVSIPQLRVIHPMCESDGVPQLHDGHSACLQQASCAEECGHRIGCSFQSMQRQDEQGAHWKGSRELSECLHSCKWVVTYAHCHCT
jgi:hypothetical protein